MHQHILGLAERGPSARFLKSPINSFFFVSTRSPAAPGLEVTDLRVDVAKLGVPVGVQRPFARLAVGLQAVAGGVESSRRPVDG